MIEAVLLSAFPRLRITWAAAPGWLGAVADVAVIAAPLLLATVAALRLATTRGWATALGLRAFRWTDLVLGVGVGLLLRAATQLLFPSGSTSLGQLGSGAGDAGAHIATAAAVAVGAVLVSPLIEEVFFRGVLARTVRDACRGLGPIASATIAVILSATAFTVLHTVTAFPSVPVSLLVATLGLGLATGILTVATGRLLAAIVAHVVFNALGVLILLI